MSRQRRFRPQSRSTRSRSSSSQLPFPLNIVVNPKFFAVFGIFFAAAIFLSIVPGISTTAPSTGDSGAPRQMNELEDRPVGTAVGADSGTPGPSASLTPTVKRYDAAPEMAIDTSKIYVATVKTAKGEIQIRLDPQAAPEAVNSFVFLAREGYYNNTPFMQLVTNQDGSKFVAQAGDPTRTGLGTPGYSIRKESTSGSFARGSVGMGGSSTTSNGGQFFISYGDYPALNGKYTIFGQVTSGLDVLDRLTLLEVSGRTTTGSGDTILSIEINES